MTDKIERLSDRELDELEGLIADADHLELALVDMRIKHGSGGEETMRAALRVFGQRKQLVSAVMRALPALLAEVRAARG